MKFNEKLIKLRKEQGMTQETLAFSLGVSRQSVSKWELGEYEPDIAKLKELAKIFSVTVDYLVNENSAREDTPPFRSVTKEETICFLASSRKNAFWIAFATFLCILSPICLLLLGGLSEVPEYGVSENLAGGVGMIVLLLFVAVAVAIFIFCGERTSDFAYLEKENFTKEALTLVERERAEYRRSYLLQNLIGACLCILSLIPLFVGTIVNPDDDLFIVGMLSLLFAIAGAGVFLIIHGGVIWASFDKLTQTKKKK